MRQLLLAFPKRGKHPRRVPHFVSAPSPEEPVAGAYYISLTGNDTNPGTAVSPWRTLTKAATTLVAGDTVYLRGGVYDVVGTDVYVGEPIFANGTALNPITIASYPGERAILDGFQHTSHPRTSGDGLSTSTPELFVFKGDFLHWKHMDFRGGVARGLSFTSDDCTFSNCRFYKNNGDGMYSYNSGGKGYRHVVEDCDAFDNFSIENGGDSASGIKLPYNFDGIIRRCRFWNNSDDGLDFYGARRMLVEDCLSFNNGYGSTGNGMGFKMSGGNDTEGTIIRRCIAAWNKNDGFDNNLGWNMVFENCTSWGNGRWGYVLRAEPTRNSDIPVDGTPNTARNCISFADATAPSLEWSDDVAYAPTIEACTWTLEITDPLFVSTLNTHVDFMELTPSSPARSVGIGGVDLGAIQFGSEHACDATGIWMSTVGGTNRVYDKLLGDGYDMYGVVGNEGFDSTSPTLRDGTPITGDALTQYNAAVYALLNASATSGDFQYVNPIEQFGATDVYNVARQGQLFMDPLMSLFRLTGDLRLLDRLCDAFGAIVWTTDWEVLAGSGWQTGASIDSLCSYPSTPSPWSPYPKVLYRGTGGSYDLDGTDLNNLNNVKLFAMVAEFAWTLHLNRATTSPGAKDYNALANTWGGVVEDFVQAWSQAGTVDCWTQNYRGDEYNTSYRVRADSGVWPVLSRNEAHAALDSIVCTYYAGLLGQTGLWDITNGVDAITKSEAISVSCATNGLVPCTTNTYGAGLLQRRSSWFNGNNTVANNTTYAAYVAGRFIQMWLMGHYRTEFDREYMTKAARVMSEVHYLTDGTTKSVNGYNTTGSGLTIDASSDLSPVQNAIKGYAKFMVFEGAGETNLATNAANTQTNTAGGYVTPDSGYLASAQFVRGVLTQLEDL